MPFYRSLALSALIFILIPFWLCSPPPTTFQAPWFAELESDRPWAGPEFWLNPLQAWHQTNGELQIIASGGDRNCVLLTREVTPDPGRLSTKTTIRRLHGPGQRWQENSTDQTATEGNVPSSSEEEGWVGFQIGLCGEFDDFRDDAIHGVGFCAGISTDGRLFIGSPSSAQPGLPGWENVEMQLDALPIDSTHYEVRLQAREMQLNARVALSRQVHASWLPGLLALTCSQGMPDSLPLSHHKPEFSELRELPKQNGGNIYAAFGLWTVEGEKLAVHNNRTFGPILWTQYTVSDQVLKMAVQMAPVGNDLHDVTLTVHGKEIARALIDTPAYNAVLRVENWNDSLKQNYIVHYRNKRGQHFQYAGIVPAMPREHLKVASLSCMDDVGFPQKDIVEHLAEHDPDLYLFHGDQLYERVGGYGVENRNKLDYLRKWYLFGWTFRELIRNRPAVIIPDDHDVFHGNLWGAGGKAADVTHGYGYEAQDDGGYKQPPSFVNLVHRTQTAHLPDPYDPTPVLQGISVYYTSMNYGGVSFAILGDRQWKSAPKALFPEAEIENGWPQNKSWNAKTQAYHPDAQLLGPRQEAFLEDWAGNWPQGTYLKAVVSQSPFCNVATLPKDIYHDKYVPTLPRYRVGEYPPDDRPVADFDSNGWPQNKRNQAIASMRKGFAIHLTGDQHLGSTGIYGIDAFGDANHWVATPAISNLWPRRWFPAAYGADGQVAGQPRNIGKYEDGFGNKMTVLAVANPYDIDREPGKIYDKAPGYTILDFDVPNREITVAIWPRWSGPGEPTDHNPYPGWPVRINQLDNYGRKRVGYLDPVEVDGNQLVKVFDDTNGELIYALRPQAGSFRPFIFDTLKTYRVSIE
ncbi:MAG: alkaline phosphatase D family protein [Saprospiraceae bacterium]|nr:alkaline phosphatase D family protein [Saprospiraceae bacterium]